MEQKDIYSLSQSPFLSCLNFVVGYAKKSPGSPQNVLMCLLVQLRSQRAFLFF